MAAESYDWGNSEDRDRFNFLLKSRIVDEAVMGIRVDNNSFEFHFENGAVIRVEAEKFNVIVKFPEQSNIGQPGMVQ